MAASTAESAVFWTVVLLRFFLPLLIPKYPLPAILACFFVDAVDLDLFKTLIEPDPTAYQGYDKALDIFYLSIAMLATLRNWASYPAVQVARCLFYLRLIGVVGFELSHWRPFLVLLPNAFEYFFILYELVRARWSPTRMPTRFYVLAAAAIWMVIKLPQEYWIHIVRLDSTTMLKVKVLGAAANDSWRQAISQQPLTFLLMIAAAVGLGAVAWLFLRRLVGPEAEHSLVLAADPLPVAIDEARERDRVIARSWRLLDLHLLEKLVLVGFVTVIFAQILPGVEARPLQLVWGVGVIVTLNAFLGIRTAQARRSLESAVLSFIVLASINVVTVAVADGLLRRGAGQLSVPATLFFLLLLTLTVTLYDRWRPVFDVRFRRGKARAASP